MMFQFTNIIKQMKTDKNITAHNHPSFVEIESLSIPVYISTILHNYITWKTTTIVLMHTPFNCHTIWRHKKSAIFTESSKNVKKTKSDGINSPSIAPSYLFSPHINTAAKQRLAKKSTQASLLPTGVGRDCHTLLDVYGSILCRSRIVVAFVEL